MNLPKCNLDYLLTDEMILRASAIFGIDEITLKKFNDMALLNTEYIRSAIAINDYEKLTKGLLYLEDASEHYTFAEVKQAIEKKYHLPKGYVGKQLSKRTKKEVFFCKKCGAVITEKIWKNSGGVCRDCYMEQLDI